MIKKYISQILSAATLLSSLYCTASSDRATKALFDALKKHDEKGVYQALNDGALVTETTYDEQLQIEGVSVLHYAAVFGESTELLQLFLERGAPVNALAGEQGTALHALLVVYAEMASGYYPQVLNYPGKVDMSELPATENCVELVRRSCVEFHNQTVDKVALLIRYGADVTIKAHGMSPLDMAEKMGAKALIKKMKKQSNLSKV